MTRRGDRTLEKEAFWKLAVDEWLAGGTSVREFCISNGLKESAFYFWRRGLAKRAGMPVAEAAGRGTKKARKNSETAHASGTNRGDA